MSDKTHNHTHGSPDDAVNAAHDALALSKQIEADGIAESGEWVAEALIRHAHKYRDLLEPFDKRVTASAPLSVTLTPKAAGC